VRKSMGDERKIPGSPVCHEIITDTVGTRPPCEQPQGTLGLLWSTLVSVGSHFWRLVVITCYMGATYVVGGLLASGLLWYLLKGHPEWFRVLKEPILWLLFTPIFTGYAYAVLLEFQGFRPRPREIFLPFDGLNLYFTVLVAGVLPDFGFWLFRVLSGSFSWSFFETLGHDRPLAAEFLRMVPGIAFKLIFLPFVFAGIDALVTRKRLLKTIGHTLGLVIRDKRLFVGFFLVSLVSLLVIATSMALFWHDRACLKEMSLTALLTTLVLMTLSMMLGAAIRVQFYREFVWREREATTLAT